MSYYERPHLTASHDEDLRAVVREWHDFARGEEYREGLNAGLELATEKRAPNWLADLREMGTVVQEDQQWSNEQWFPRAMDSPLRHMAVVKPESVIANMSVENIMQEIEGEDLTTHYFDNRPDAEAWLRERMLTA